MSFSSKIADFKEKLTFISKFGVDYSAYVPPALNMYVTKFGLINTSAPYDLSLTLCFCLIFQTANLVFFVLTSRKLYETWRLTKANLDTNEFRVSPRAQRNSNNFKVIFKIFVIMGVTWFSELFGFILSWICGRDKVWKYFVLNDIINLLQACYCYC